MTLQKHSHRKAEKRNPVLPRSAGRYLQVLPSLLETLVVDRKILARTNESNKDLRKFIDAAEEAWRHVWKNVERGEKNAILWLRQLLAECRVSCIWVPKVFIRRLRQLERGEISIADRNGRLFRVPLHDGLPEEFQECAEFMGWNFSHIVPSLNENVFEDVQSGEDKSAFVAAIEIAWDDRPSDLRGKQLANWIKSELDKAGWKIN